MLVAQAIATFHIWYGDDVRFARDAEAELTALVEAP